MPDSIHTDTVNVLLIRELIGQWPQIDLGIIWQGRQLTIPCNGKVFFSQVYIILLSSHLFLLPPGFVKVWWLLTWNTVIKKLDSIPELSHHCIKADGSDWILIRESLNLSQANCCSCLWFIYCLLDNKYLAEHRLQIPKSCIAVWCMNILCDKKLLSDM